jgi:hypothetical protein
MTLDRDGTPCDLLAVDVPPGERVAGREARHDRRRRGAAARCERQLVGDVDLESVAVGTVEDGGHDEVRGIGGQLVGALPAKAHGERSGPPHGDHGEPQRQGHSQAVEPGPEVRGRAGDADGDASRQDHGENTVAALAVLCRRVYPHDRGTTDTATLKDGGDVGE